MFQIETALLKFDAMIDGQSEKGGSVVKRYVSQRKKTISVRSKAVDRLFYGKIRQRLTGVVPNSRSSIHEKEDLFSHLPVNVTNDGVDIYDGLSGYFDDIVDWEGGKARMEVSLVEAPPLLQIQLQVRRVCQLTLITSLVHYFNTEGPVQPRDSAAIQIAGVCQVR